MDLIIVSNKLPLIMYTLDTTIYFNLEDFNQENLEEKINCEQYRAREWVKKLLLIATKTKS